MPQCRILLWSLVGLALIAALGYAFMPRPIPVDIAAVTTGPLVVTVDEEGATRVQDIFVLSAPVAGRARRVYSKVGDVVEADKTVVAQIEPADPTFLDVRSEAEARASVQAAEAAKALAVAKLQEAQAELAFARSELARARRLIKTSTISERALDQAKRAFDTRTAAVNTAKAELRIRHSELARARARLVSPVTTQAIHGKCDCIPIIAPVSGQILRVLHESEGVVQLMIEGWGGDSPIGGSVRRIEPYGFTKVSALGIEEQRVNVIIDFTDPPKRWRRLGHGYRAEVRIVLFEAPNALKVPLTALFRDGERWAVFVVDAGRARRRIVSIGRRTARQAEITAGLKAGERIVLHPSQSIEDGTRVAGRSNGL